MVVLIGGASGNGKTTLAETLGRRFGVPWLQVDDLRLTLQYGGLLTATTHPALFAFLGSERVWHRPPQVLCDQLIALGSLLIPAIETVVTHHLSTGKPVIIEGDGLLPSLFGRPALRAAVVGGKMRGVFLTATVAQRRANLVARGERSGSRAAGTAQQAGEAMNALYDDWIGAEAARYRIPLVASHPHTTLAERIIATLGLA
jgi:2-phosphoglycerate kinase